MSSFDDAGSDVSHTSEIALITSLFDNFAKQELREQREILERYPFVEFPTKMVSKSLELGMFDLLTPESVGGAEQTREVLCTQLVLLSETNAGMASIIFVDALCQTVFLLCEQPDFFIDRAGENQPDRLPLLAFPCFDNPTMTPPQVIAQSNGADYTLSGKVDYLSMGGQARQALIPALLPNESAFSYFLIDLMDEGVSVSAPLFGLGVNICPAVDVTLNAVAAKLVGEAGCGAALHQRIVDKMIVCAAGMSLGTMKGSLQEAMEYSHQRKQGGRLISEWSEVRSILSSMVVSTHTAELALKQAAMMVEKELPGWQTSARAVAAHIQDVACQVTTDGIQVLGGYGYMTDYGQEKRFRDATHLQSLFGLSKMKRMDCLKSLVGDLALDQ